ncbi:MAG: hypothetical protein ACR2JC_05430 [Chloroflexota bacterium]|nr:MAG: hypothetical protein DLM70_05090 [Chloroflexota bacterium]
MLRVAIASIRPVIRLGLQARGVLFSFRAMIALLLATQIWSVPSEVRANPTARPATPVADLAACPATAFTSDSPPGASLASFTSTWYTNSDHSLWAGLPSPYDGKWYAGVGQKILWIRHGQLGIRIAPLGGAGLEVRGDVPPGYEGVNYQPSGIRIPTSGCWRIVGRAGGDMLDYAARAYPKSYRPSDVNLETLSALACGSSATVLVSVQNTRSLNGDFWIQVTKILRSWSARVHPGEAIDVLQDQLPPVFRGVTLEVPLDRGQHYVLFLQRRKGNLWRIIGHTGRVVDGRVVEAHFVQGARFWQWSGEGLPNVERSLTRITSHCRRRGANQ